MIALVVAIIISYSISSAAHGPLLLAGGLLLLAGLIFFCTGFLGEVLIRTYFESQGRRIYAVREVRAWKGTAAAERSER